MSIPCHSLNIIDKYNYNKNIVDVADELRGSCRFDNWIIKEEIVL